MPSVTLCHNSSDHTAVHSERQARLIGNQDLALSCRLTTKVTGIRLRPRSPVETRRPQEISA